MQEGTQNARGYTSAARDAIQLLIGISLVSWAIQIGATRVLFPPDLHSPAVALAATALAVLAGCLLIWGRRRWSALVSYIIMWAATLTQLVNIASPTALDGYIYALWWSVAATSWAAMAFQTRAAYWLTLISGAVIAGFWLLRLASIGALADWALPVFAFSFGAAAGLGYIWLFASVRSTGIELDRVQAATASAILDEVRQETREAELMRISRLLHETVVNTLGVVARGVQRPQLERLRARCRADLGQISSYGEQLNEMTPVPRPLGDLEAIALAHSEAVDVPLLIRWEGDSDLLLPAVVFDALTRAVNEAITNVAKHSLTRSAELHVRQERAFLIELTDEGRGFRPDRVALRGISSSIIDPAHAVGIASHVASTPGKGTTVTLHWEPPRFAAPDPDRPFYPDFNPPATLNRSARICGPPTLAALVAVLIVEFMLGAPSVTSAAFLAARTIGLIAVVTLSIWVIATVSRRYPLSNKVMALTCVIIFFSTYTSMAGAPECTSTDVLWYGTMVGAVGIEIGAMFARNHWWAPAAWLTYLCAIAAAAMTPGMLQGQCTWENLPVLRSDLLMFLLWYGSRLTLDYVGRRAARDYERFLSAAARAQAAQERSRTAETRIASTLAPAVGLMSELADGSADPADPAVRSKASKIENYVRNVGLVPASSSHAEELLLSLIVSGYERDVQVEVLLVDDLGDIADGEIERLIATGREIVAQLSSGDVIHVSATATAGAGELLLVVDTAQTLTLSAKNIANGTASSGDGQAVIQLTWKAIAPSPVPSSLNNV